MYDVVAMKTKLENAAQVVGDEIRTEFKTEFLKIYPDKKIPDTLTQSYPEITKTAITLLENINSIYYAQGLYIILSNYNVAGNNCSLQLNNLKAIYRGECSTVKQRVKSHLFHSAYKKEHATNAKNYEADPKNAGKSYYKEFWPHCLKLEANGLSGIDVDQSPYSSYEWVVVVHKMKGSSQQVRQLAELAFDDAFGHPAGSRDVPTQQTLISS